MPNLPVLIVVGVIVSAVLYYLFQRKSVPVRKVTHEYFNRVWIWPTGSHTRWEAELDLIMPGADKKVGFHSETLHEEVDLECPTDNEVAFCKRWMENLDGLFQLTKPAIEDAWGEWIKKEMPNDWRTVLSLDGFSVPKDGDMKQPWGITYFCEPANHYFYINIRDGKAFLASVDG